MKKKEYLKQFEEKFTTYDTQRGLLIVAKEQASDIKVFISSMYDELEKQAAEDICTLIDDIEVRHYSHSSMDIWKLFKRIRNKIRDTYDPEGFQKEEQEKEIEQSVICDRCNCFVSVHGDNDVCYGCKGEDSKG